MRSIPRGKILYEDRWTKHTAQANTVGTDLAIRETVRYVGILDVRDYANAE